MANSTRIPSMFAGAVWDASPHADIRVPTHAEAQRTVLAALLDTPLKQQRRSALDWFVSLGVHAIVLAALLIAPLFFTQVLDLHNLQVTYLVAPAPPSAPPPPAPAGAPKAVPAAQKLAPRVVLKLVAPSLIPRNIAVVREPQAAPEISGGVIGGIPGGVTGGVLGGIIGGTAVLPAPVPPAPVAEKKEKEILHLGGDVKPPRALFTPAPRYPQLAKAAHLTGTVFIEAVIDEKGNVVNAHALQGDRILAPEALRAVMLWKYEPTYLNGVPYPLRMTVTVVFSLSS